MAKEKITLNMSTMEIIMVMSEGNSRVMAVICEMLRDQKKMLDILFLDSLGIRGLQLYLLSEVCCRRDERVLARVLMMMRCGIFSDEEIQSNLVPDIALPFINEGIEVAGVPLCEYEYDDEEKFGPTDAKWEEYCQKQHDSFARRLASYLEHQNKKER